MQEETESEIIQESPRNNLIRDDTPLNENHPNQNIKEIPYGEQDDFEMEFNNANDAPENMY